MDTYYKINGERLTEIADAIREKTGGTELLTLDQMVDAINGIQTGGGTMPSMGILINSVGLSVEIEEVS